jgi:hypothetical protein
VQSALRERARLRHRHARRAYAFFGGAIARRADDARARIERAEPTLRFSSAFAGECDDNRVGTHAAHDRFEQRGFSATGRTEDAYARTTPDRQQRIDTAHTGPERTVDRGALRRGRR